MKANSLLKGLVGAAFLIGAAVSAHAADTLAAVKAAGTLKVGTETAFAPFDYIDAGEHTGLNVDLFAEIGKELGVKIEWVALPWDGVFPALGPANSMSSQVLQQLPRSAWSAIASRRRSPKRRLPF